MFIVVSIIQAVVVCVIISLKIKITRDWDGYEIDVKFKYPSFKNKDKDDHH